MPAVLVTGPTVTQRPPSAVGHEAAIICQVERHLPGQRLVNQTCHFELELMVSHYCTVSIYILPYQVKTTKKVH